MPPKKKMGGRGRGRQPMGQEPTQSPEQAPQQTPKEEYLTLGGAGRGMGHGQTPIQTQSTSRPTWAQQPDTSVREQPRHEQTARQQEEYHTLGATGIGRGQGSTQEVTRRQMQQPSEPHLPAWGPRAQTAPTVMASPPGFPSASQAQTVMASQPDFPSASQAQIAPSVNLIAPTASRNVRALPKRPGFGTQGRLIKLIANHFPITIQGGSIFHYDVEIEQLKSLKARPQQLTNKKIPPEISRQIVKQLETRLKIAFPEFKGNKLAYDGNKNIFTRKRLPFNEPKHLTVTLRENGRDVDSQFRVSIKPVEREATGNCEISLEPLKEYFKYKESIFNLPREQFMAVDIILRSEPAIHMLQIRSTFFDILGNPRDKTVIEGGAEVWFGTYQSLRPGQWKPMLNVNKSATILFPPGPVIYFFVSFLKLNHPNDVVKLDDRDISKLNEQMKRVRIAVTHMAGYKRKYWVVCVKNQSARDIKFMEEKNGVKKETTIAEYFKRTYKPLKHPDWPCLQVGNKDKKIFMPLEVCELVPGQQYKRKLLNPTQARQFVQFTAMEPAQRFKTIKSDVKALNEMTKEYQEEFGITIGQEPVHLQGRVLNPPKVLYDNKRTILPINGSWDMKGHSFFKPCTIKKWAIVSFSKDTYCNQKLGQLASMLIGEGHKMGMTIPQCTTILNKEREMARYLYSDPQTVGQGTFQILSQIKQEIPGLQLLVVVLGVKTNYNAIKAAGDLKIGLMTQCLKDNNVAKKLTNQLIVNVLQKINAKMSGTNNLLNPNEQPHIFNRPVIIMGADVNHPAPGVMLPSIAAVVGSEDSLACRYNKQVRFQRNRNDEMACRVESILELKDMVKNLLIAFYKNTKQKPEKIIFYRDGVSEGQFADVQENEIPQIRQACRELQADYEPGITFVIVAKRHHTRFMPEDPRDGVGRPKNIPPGTMVDREVCSAVDFDFFLCSHTGIQGTSRPAHYTVIWDDNDMSADELHKLTFHLCHNYVRCTKSTSIPSPVQYAHLVAYRGHCHTQIYGSMADANQEGIQVTGDVTNTMYYV